MAKVELRRRMHADPAGVALLLADPDARELWPRARAWCGSPQRAGVGFVCELTVADPPARGRISIRPAADGPGVTAVRLLLQAPGGEGCLAAACDQFLTRLGQAAHARSSAA